MNNKPFDLKKALAGEPVRFKEADWAVSEMFYSKQRASLGYAPIIIIAENGNEYACWEDGRRYKGGEDPFDILMAPVKKTVWVNMWRDLCTGAIRSSDPVMDSEEQVLAHVSATYHNYIGTYPIEIEL